MARTTPQAVAAIVETDGGVDLAPFIADAGALIDAICVPAGLLAPMDAIVEKYLAAHFYSVTSPRIASTNAKGVGVSFQQRVDLNLSLTGYGQQAMLFDTTGALAKWNQDTIKGTPKMNIGLLYIGGCLPGGSKCPPCGPSELGGCC